MEKLTYKIMIWSSVLSTVVTLVAFFFFIVKEVIKWL